MKRYSPVSMNRVKLSVPSIAVLCALFIVVFDNRLFWSTLGKRLGLNQTSDWWFSLTVGIILVLLFVIHFLLFSYKPIFKPFLTIMLLSAAAISYFMDNFGVIVDKSMVYNVLETDVNEASELLSWPLLWHLLWLAGIPAALLWMAPVRSCPWRRALLVRGGLILGCLLIISGLLLTEFKTFALFGRQNKDLKMFVNPFYAAHSVQRVMAHTYFTPEEKPFKLIATDAVATPHDRRSVLVLVVGETARAQSWHMNGYARETNPYLEQQPVLDFSNVQSCGTATAESLPCMFSALGHGQYKRDKALHSENILDVLQRMGVDVVWRDNDSGSKGVATRVAYQNFNKAENSDFCAAGNCFDEVLLEGLDDLIGSSDKDMLIVLHLKGSHGPSYYKRSPEDFKKFTPECTQDNIQDCPREEIVNAYDNTLVYTDFVLDKLIRQLEKQDEATAVLYLSDHGESLGENGIYLHGMPYALAPPEQTHVPMMFWASSLFLEEKHLNLLDLGHRTGEALTHDYLFHSLLGLFDVQTETYHPELDLFASSRGLSLVQSNSHGVRDNI